MPEKNPKTHRYRETKITEPAGHGRVRHVLARVQEGETLPTGAIETTDPVTDEWSYVGIHKEEK